MSLERYGDAQERLREAERLSPGAPENADLQARLDTAQNGAFLMQGVDGQGETLEELQARIHWGFGRSRKER
jgi:hypothetical protein